MTLLIYIYTYTYVYIYIYTYIYIYIYKAKFDVQNPIIRSLLEQIDTSKITSSGIKKLQRKCLTQKMYELRERLNKLKNYNDAGRNLPSPLPGDLPQPPSGEFSWVPLSSNYKNNINNYNDDDEYDFPLPPSVSQYSSRIPPSNDIPQAPLIFTPWPSPTSGSDLLKTY